MTRQMIVYLAMDRGKATKGGLRMRVSGDQYQAGQLLNGFDYDLQVWVKAGVIQPVGSGYQDHKEWAGQKVTDIRAQLGV